MAKLRLVNSRVPDQCKDATLVYKEFERLGLFILSDKLLQNTECDTLIDVTENSRNLAADNDPWYSPFDKDIDDDNDGILDSEYEYFDNIIEYPVLSIPTDGDGILDAFYEDHDDFDDDCDGILDAEDPGHPQSSAAPRPDVAESTEVKNPKLDLRNYFPETWLFDLVELDSNGENILPLEAPHTITTWIAETVCTDIVNGAQVSEKANLLVIQDFFVDINIPYSIKRGEQFPLNVSIFNFIDQKLPMKITLKASEQYKAGQSEENVCLQPQDNIIISFDVKAKELHEVNITVEAMIDSAKNPGCNDNLGTVDGYKDTIQKSIEVKPEGFPVEKVDSEFICRKEEDEETILDLNALTLPGEVQLVDDSERAWITVNGEIMAPALSNLERLLQLPTGCGEQVTSNYQLPNHISNPFSFYIQ